MITEPKFVYSLMLVYMFVNLYTDIKYLKTKNIWHLMMLITLLVLSSYSDGVFESVIALIGGLIVGIGFRRLPGAYGAGDVKMLTVLFVGISIMGENQLKNIVIFLLFYTILSLLHMGILKVIQKNVKSNFNIGRYTVKENHVEVPEAVPLFVSILLAPLLFI